MTEVLGSRFWVLGNRFSVFGVRSSKICTGYRLPATGYQSLSPVPCPLSTNSRLTSHDSRLELATGYWLLATQFAPSRLRASAPKEFR
jgi:hypothetical protein